MLTSLVTAASPYTFPASPAFSSSAPSAQGDAAAPTALATRSGMPPQAEHWLGYLPNVSTHFGVRHRRVKDVKATSEKPAAPIKKKVTVDLDTLKQTEEGKQLIRLAFQLRELEPKETDGTISDKEQARLQGVRSDINLLAPEDRGKITPIIKALDEQDQNKAQQKSSSKKSRTTPVKGAGKAARSKRKQENKGNNAK